jgi:hypothetical protein
VPARTPSRKRRTIPQGRGDYWRKVHCILLVDEGAEVHIKKLLSKVGLKESGGVLDLWDAATPTLGTSVTISRVNLPPELKPQTAPAVWSITLDTLKYSIKRPKTVAQADFTHRRFLDVVTEQVVDGTKELFCGVEVEFQIPSPPAKWRLPLLSRPPQVTGVEDPVGEISLAGLTLDFDSPGAGLKRVSMTRNRFQPMLDLNVNFATSIETAKVVDLYVEVLKKAKKFTELFVHLRPELSSS